MRLRDVEFRLYRRVIEIHDALLVLRAELGEHAGSARVPEVVTVLSSAIRAAGGMDVADTSAQPAGQVSDWAAERDWMVHVALHYKAARRRRHLLAGAGQAEVREAAG